MILEIEGDVFILCGTHVFYLLKDMFFDQCEDSKIDIGVAEIVEFGRWWIPWSMGAWVCGKIGERMWWIEKLKWGFGRQSLIGKW